MAESEMFFNGESEICRVYGVTHCKQNRQIMKESKSTYGYPYTLSEKIRPKLDNYNNIINNKLL